MASTYSAIACPHCGCCATEDNYYKIGELFIWCYRCGYTYEKIIDYWNENEPVFLEKEYKGYGICRLHKENGGGFNKILQRPLSSEEVNEYLDAFRKVDADLEKSYFTIFEEGEFQTLAGNPPEDFYLSFEAYKKKMEANDQQLEIIVPV